MLCKGSGWSMPFWMWDYFWEGLSDKTESFWFTCLRLTYLSFSGLQNFKNWSWGFVSVCFSHGSNFFLIGICTEVCTYCTLLRGGALSFTVINQAVLATTERTAVYCTQKAWRGQAWWRVPVIPATQEAETGGCSEPRVHHCTSAWVTEQEYLK